MRSQCSSPCFPTEASGKTNAPGGKPDLGDWSRAVGIGRGVKRVVAPAVH
ncbi:MAG: hypothetical protein ACREPR_26535 [Brasilonema sp.]